MSREKLFRWIWVRPNYMKRMTFAPKNRWFNVYLHRYFGNDAMTYGLHDHPWNSLSIRIWGKPLQEYKFGKSHYNELGVFTSMTQPRVYIPKDKLLQFRTVPRFVYRRADEAHSLVCRNPGTITLFITGKRIREWGFWTGKTGAIWESADLIHERERMKNNARGNYNVRDYCTVGRS